MKDCTKAIYTCLSSLFAYLAGLFTIERILWILLFIALGFIIWQFTPPSDMNISIMSIIGIALLLIGSIVVCLRVRAVAIAAKKMDQSKLRGLLLPNGTIRGSLAYLIIWFYLVFAIFGFSFIFDITHLILENNNNSPTLEQIAGLATSIYNATITALTGLSAAVIGFYFGGRTATVDPAIMQSIINLRQRVDKPETPSPNENNQQGSGQ